MTRSIDDSWNRDALLRKVANLTPELYSLILGYCVGTPTLVIDECEFFSITCLSYVPEMPPSGLPLCLREEHQRLVRQKWLRSRKTFYDAVTFITTHLACVMRRRGYDIVPILEACANQLSKVPFRMQYCPMLDLTGLEDIELELPTDVFFSLFRVAAPPFPTPDHMYFDETFFGAGTLLAHTRKLAMTFTTSNPWYNLTLGPWAEGDAEAVQPRERGNVCTSGLIIDWILTYAWHHNTLQHVRWIELKGDVQEWVKSKWYNIFAGTRLEQENVATAQRIQEIEHYGEQESLATGNAWDPTEHYPPACRCQVNCSRLRYGVIEPEIPTADRSHVEQWEAYPIEEFPPVELQPWYCKADWV